jgi:thiamine biosynthesis protein ThiC
MKQILEARKGNITPEMEAVARAEQVSVEYVRDGIAARRYRSRDHRYYPEQPAQ